MDKFKPIITLFVEKHKKNNSIASFRQFVIGYFDTLQASSLSKEERDILKRVFKNVAVELGVQSNFENSHWNKEETDEINNDSPFFITGVATKNQGMKKSLVNDQDSKSKEKAEESTTSSRGRIIVYYNKETLEQSNIEWMINEEDHSSSIMAFRARSIAAADEGKILPTNLMLALNHVVFFDKRLAILNELDLVHKKRDIEQSLNRNQGKYRCQEGLVALAYQLVEKVEEDDEEDAVELLILEERAKATKEKDGDKKLLLSLFETYVSKLLNLNMTTEQTYIDSTLFPLLEHFFGRIEGTQHFSARGYLEPLPASPVLLLPISCSTPSTASASASTSTTSPTPTTSSSSSSNKRKSPSHCSWMSLQPDYLLKAVFSGVKFDLFAVEVKKPNCEITQLVNDEAKLDNLLKLMLDRLVVDKIPSPVVCGVVDDGSNIKTYKMSIKSNGKYDFVQLACFPGIRCVDDLVCLPSMINHLKQMQTIIEDMQCIIRLALLGKTLPGPVSLFSVPVEWLRPSQEYPVANAANKRQK